jgi:hypothetical protein
MARLKSGAAPVPAISPELSETAKGPVQRLHRQYLMARRRDRQLALYHQSGRDLYRDVARLSELIAVLGKVRSHTYGRATVVRKENDQLAASFSTYSVGSQSTARQSYSRRAERESI